MNIQPKNNFIDSTRELINSSGFSQEIVINTIPIITDPEVFNPGVFFSSTWFAKQIAGYIKGEHVLIEVGCGTGIVSIQSALQNEVLIVHATDINERATELTKKNADSNGVGERIATYTGDVLDSISLEVQADSIFWAMPFGYLDPREKLLGKDTQVFDPGYRAIEKFFVTAKNYLKTDGRLLVGFSNDIGHFELLEKFAKENSFTLRLLTETKGIEKDSVSMEIYEAKVL